MLNLLIDDKYLKNHGVLKYKKRKAESLQKLDHTEDNLTRVEDILYDLEGRVEPLKAEASIAKEYLKLSEEMKQSDVIVTVNDIDQYSEDNRQLDQKLNDLKANKRIKKQNKLRLINIFKSKSLNVNKLIMTLNN